MFLNLEQSQGTQCSVGINIHYVGCITNPKVLNKPTQFLMLLLNWKKNFAAVIKSSIKVATVTLNFLREAKGGFINFVNFCGPGQRP